MAKTPQPTNERGTPAKAASPGTQAPGGAAVSTSLAGPAGSGSPVAPGAAVQSGSPVSTTGSVGTGAPRAVGGTSWGAFTIGEGIRRPAASPFQLAPRLYVLSRGNMSQSKVSQTGQGSQPCDELPQHLIFRESPSDGGERTHQRWISEEGGRWTWELVVEQQNGTVRATLTARSNDTDGKSGRLWTTSGGWDAFGSNHLDPGPGEHEMPPLIVAAP